MAEKYSLTEEHKAQLPGWTDKWVKIAFATGPYTDDQRKQYVEAMFGLYAAANLKAPTAVEFIPSPITGAFVTGITLALQALPGSPVDRGIALRAVADAADSLQGCKPLQTQTASLRVAKALGIEVEVTQEPMRKSAVPLVESMLNYSTQALDCRDGGNQWAGYAAYLSFFRHVVQLPIDYSKWAHYETLAHAGPRYLTPDFALISELPDVLKVDPENRPHCASGPFCQWPDGRALYYWHGVEIPAEWISVPGTLTPQVALSQENTELRRCGCEMLGWVNIIEALPHKVLDKDKDPQIGTLVIVDLPDAPASKFLLVQCGTGRIFALYAPHAAKTAREAQQMMYQVKEYKPDVRT